MYKRQEREIRADDANVVGHDGLHLALGLDDHQHLFEPKSTLGVDVEGDFTPNYRPIKGKEDIIKDLKNSFEFQPCGRTPQVDCLLR